LIEIVTEEFSGFDESVEGGVGVGGGDGGEGLAVESAGAVFGEGTSVLGRGVAFVRGETVLGMEEVELAHEAVAMDFRDDGRGGNGEGERVAVVEAGLRAGVRELREVEQHRVNEQVVGRGGEALDGLEHSETGGLVDVDAVDSLGVDFGDGDAEGDFADLAVECFALLAGELFRVLEAHAGEGGEPGGEDDGSGDDGAEESSSADLVYTGDEAIAVVAEGLLGGVRADELLEHLLLGGGFGDAGDLWDSEESGHHLSPRGATLSVSRAGVDELITKVEGGTRTGDVLEVMEAFVGKWGMKQRRGDPMGRLS